MDNPVDNIVDLGLVNYVQHPGNANYIIFRFADINRANSFEQELTKEKIWFERDEEGGGKYYLFGIHKNDFKRVERLNFRVEGMHKKPLIPFSLLRYSLLLFSGIVMFLAIMGYCKSREHLRTVNEQMVPVNDSTSTQ